jgi:hypothetical protein
MAALAAVARGHDRVSVLAPGGDDPLDRLRREIGPVGQDDHSGLCVQRGQAAAEGGAGSSLPLGAADDARVGLDVVRAEDDDDILDRRAAQALEDLGKEQPLLRRAEPRRRAGCEDDGPDQVQPRSERQAAVTFAT